MKYKIRWVSMIGNSGYIEPEEYDDKKCAEDDAKMYNKAHPGISHYVVEIDDEKL